MKWNITNHDHGMLLREYLTQKLHISSRLLKTLKAVDGGLLVNGEEKTVRYQLCAGDQLEVHFPKEERGTSMLPENIPLHIIYEDEHLLVVNKESGMPSIPSKIHPSGTVANGLLYHYERQGIFSTIHVVTRLDKDTSGLMLIAKHPYSHSLLSNQQRKNELDRTYLAVVHGKLKNKIGTINKPIARNPESIIERIVCETGQRAVTHYEVLKEYSPYSLVKVQLETGRTHQIRVHFANLGHPLVGDDLYGGNVHYINRQALHCYSLQFKHPFTNKQLNFCQALPKDLSFLFSK